MERGKNFLFAVTLGSLVLSTHSGVAIAAEVPTVRFTAEPVIVSEGGQLFWHFRLTKPAPPEGLVLRLSLLRDTDPVPGDVQFFVEGSTNITNFQLIRGADGLVTDALVSVAEGARQATLVSTVIDDGVAEGEESATYALVVNTGYKIDRKRDSASFTLTDYPVVSLNSEPAVVKEGEQLFFDFTLTKPAPAGGLVLRLTLARDTDPLAGDIQYFVAGSTNITGFQLVKGADGIIYNALVAIAEGATTATLVSHIIEDNVHEGREKITYRLAVGAGYSIDLINDSANFTIKDR
ncbi:MAG TPA: hypothetical protein VGX03_01060 [Candidatus Binatia bacterium]|nr:hypothetical protein [Candidatus Binatia bacterium]